MAEGWGFHTFVAAEPFSRQNLNQKKKKTQEELFGSRPFDSETPRVHGWVGAPCMSPGEHRGCFGGRKGGAILRPSALPQSLFLPLPRGSHRAEAPAWGRVARPLCAGWRSCPDPLSSQRSGYCPPSQMAAVRPPPQTAPLGVPTLCAGVAAWGDAWGDAWIWRGSAEAEGQGILCKPGIAQTEWLRLRSPEMEPRAALAWALPLLTAWPRAPNAASAGQSPGPGPGSRMTTSMWGFGSRHPRLWGQVEAPAEDTGRPCLGYHPWSIPGQGPPKGWLGSSRLQPSPEMTFRPVGSWVCPCHPLPLHPVWGASRSGLGASSMSTPTWSPPGACWLGRPGQGAPPRVALANALGKMAGLEHWTEPSAGRSAVAAPAVPHPHPPAGGLARASRSR